MNSQTTSRSARLLYPIPSTCAKGFLLNLFGRVAYHHNEVPCFEGCHRRIVETAQSLVADYSYHAFSIDLAGRTADLFLGDGPLPHLETFIARQ
jgi:hypothetical protein